MGSYGDKLAHTPTIDALAKRGLLYRNSYSNVPVCAPSRFAILTGMPPESCSPANQHRARARLPASFRAVSTRTDSVGIPKRPDVIHMWTPPWQGPLSGRVLIGCFHMSGLFVRRFGCRWPCWKSAGEVPKQAPAP
ncbi:sulfatase-like hydrolase/transferase [Novosphingobium aerophilum]|uniref:sulfatase-like hydrolase/transferase n=1 Tax=Novosphingobium aerophilum TaxID=2839843 RepID=UPI0022A88B02|nr:sulfatase-like hydrolase/transferase [Novosphingobium aerophilum]